MYHPYIIINYKLHNFHSFNAQIHSSSVGAICTSISTPFSRDSSFEPLVDYASRNPPKVLSIYFINSVINRIPTQFSFLLRYIFTSSSGAWPEAAFLYFLPHQSAKAKSRHKTITPMAAQRPITAFSPVGRQEE